MQWICEFVIADSIYFRSWCFIKSSCLEKTCLSSGKAAALSCPDLLWPLQVYLYPHRDHVVIMLLCEKYWRLKMSSMTVLPRGTADGCKYWALVPVAMEKRLLGITDQRGITFSFTAHGRLGACALFIKRGGYTWMHYGKKARQWRLWDV